MIEYRIGLLTGFLLCMCCILFISAQSSFQRLTLGELTINKLSVVNDKGDVICGISGKDSGIFTLYKDNEPFAILDAEGGQSASLSLYNTDKIHRIQSRISEGKFQSFHENGKEAVMFGIDETIIGNGKISIHDPNESLKCLITSEGDFSMFYNNDSGKFSSRISGKGTAKFMNSVDSSGIFIGFNKEGTGGMAQFRNNYGKTISTIGTNRERDGYLIINDRYGNIGKEMNGKLQNKANKEVE
tara:strand:- start:1110 stop:1838 length:729 start_codon:yes stop_codon:yes gene_type:complete